MRDTLKFTMRKIWSKSGFRGSRAVGQSHRVIPQVVVGSVSSWLKALGRVNCNLFCTAQVDLFFTLFCGRCQVPFGWSPLWGLPANYSTGTPYFHSLKNYRLNSFVLLLYPMFLVSALPCFWRSSRVLLLFWCILLRGTIWPDERDCVFFMLFALEAGVPPTRLSSSRLFVFVAFNSLSSLVLRAKSTALRKLLLQFSAR